MRLPTFLALPDRPSKPRVLGVTHVLDDGVGVATAESVLRSASAHIDIWKFGWGTAYLDTGLPDKVALLKAAHVTSCLGGTLMEIAWAQGRAAECLDWAQGAGIDAVEVSRGLMAMSLEDKHELIRQAGQRFVVLSEVGSKDPSTDIPPDQWAEEVSRDSETGARWVVIEGRESGTVGLYRGDATVREDVVASVVRAAGVEKVVFEAPRKEQQAWFIRRFGPNVNLGNVPLDAALSLETLRRGLRADTWESSHRGVFV